MRIVGHILVWVFLAVGTLAATTAYQVRLGGLSDEELAELADKLTLNADAGVSVEPDDNGRDQVKPLYKRGTTLTLVDLKMLQENEAKFLGRDIKGSTIWVKKFHFLLWPGKWIFMLSVASMVTGAVLLRRASTSGASPAVRSDVGESPQALLETAASELRTVRAEVEKEPSEAVRLALILERLGKLQATALDSFVETRQRMATELGTGRMAEVMAEFSVAERQINRAWSAACDQHEEEARGCLDRAVELMQRPLELLKGS